MSVIQCPVCQSDVQAGFGMVVCPQCRTPLFFDFDGNLQMATEESEVLEKSENLDNNFITDDDSNKINETILDSSSKDIPSDFSVKNYTLDSLAEIDNSETESDHEVNLPEYTNQSLTNSSIEFNNNSKNSQNLKEQSSSQDSFIYKIFIKGIDGNRLRSEIYEELKDPRWGWVALELMNQIQAGELVLKKVNGVKASLLINRLKALPIEITWMVDNEINTEDNVQV